MLSKKMLALAASALLVTSGAGSAQTAQSLSVAGSLAAAPAGADLGQANELRGNGWILGIVLVGILVFVLVELSKDNDLPNSP